MFRPCHLKDSHRSLPALFDFVRMPKNPEEVSLCQSPRDLLTISLLAQYYSATTTGCSLWVAHSWTCFPFLAKDQTEEGGGSL